MKEKKLLKLRGIVETVFEQLQDHMKINDTKAKSHKGLQARVNFIITSFTFGIYLNSLLNRPPLALKSLLV